MDNQVASILQQLKDNKKVKKASTNSKGAYERRNGTASKKRRTKRNSSKPIGKHVGYCSTCMIMVGSKECHPAEMEDPNDVIVFECTRCGTELEYADSLPKGVCNKTLIAWRRHDKWGNCSIPSNQTQIQACHAASYEKCMRAMSVRII